MQKTNTSLRVHPEKSTPSKAIRVYCERNELVHRKATRVYSE